MKTEPVGPPGPLLRWDRDSRTLRQARYSVRVIAGPDTGHRFVLEQAVVVGSDPGAGLVLSDRAVSRRHLELEPRADGVRVRDLGSTNGVLHAGIRIEAATLVADSELVVGRTTLRIVLTEENLGAPPPSSSFGSVLGESAAMRALFGILSRVSPTDSTVLLLGETGTGKDLIARSIHDASRRRDGPFVVFDCSAVAPNLVESELFGHAKGAFTGAVADRAGAFVQAHGGTLFFDELGELPLELQAKLLRALEAGTVKRVGDDRARAVNVRVIAATHRDLEREVEAGRFRRDLYFRVAVIPVRVPPLRERPEDCALLARHFARAINPAFAPGEPLLSKLASYDWPGNVRELRNVVERALSGGDFVEPTRRAPPAQPELTEVPFKQAKEALVETFTRDYLTALYERCGGNISQMARVARINRNYVQALVARFELKPRRAEPS